MKLEPKPDSMVECVNGCKNPQGGLIKMKLISSRYDIIFKKQRVAMQCPMCGRWEFER